MGPKFECIYLDGPRDLQNSAGVSISYVPHLGICRKECLRFIKQSFGREIHFYPNTSVV